MSGHQESGSGPGRKPYVKPQVKRVELKPEEAVLGACKSASYGGPAQAKCNLPANCRSIGS